MSDTSDVTSTIETIISNAMDKADTYCTESDTAAQELIAKTSGMYLTPPDSDADFDISAIEPDVPDTDGSDILLIYNAYLDKIVNLLSDELAAFFTKYYPLNSDAYDEAVQWVINEITNGGTGINEDVETQLWQRQRERTTKEIASTVAQIVTGYEAKGYILPAGSMLKKVDQARFQGLAAKGDASTQIAAKQFEAELATIKFAVQQAFDMRKAAMEAAADYIRALTGALGNVQNIAELIDNAKASLMNATANFYQARLEKDKIILDSKLAELNHGLQVYMHRRNNATENDRVECQALEAALSNYGSRASAALSSLNSIVSTAAVSL